MTYWKVEWRSSGTAIVEADDQAEASEQVYDAIQGFDTMMLEHIDVDDVTIVKCTTDVED